MNLHRNDASLELAASLGLELCYDLALQPFAALGAAVVRLSPDPATLTYLQGAERRRHGAFLTFLHRRLRSVWSDFDINGYLGMYPLHVLSTEQWQVLLGEHVPSGRLLDVGAGRGDVTAELARLHTDVTVTETSRGMARRLRRQGYRVLPVDLAQTELGESFDTVSLLNVLDRCDRPLSLLGQARRLLVPGGLLVVALVLPYRPFVYRGGVASSPRERLPITSREFEAAAAEFVSLALLPLGLQPLVVSRVPYLSGGDTQRPIYELDDFVVVCRAVGAPPPILGR